MGRGLAFLFSVTVIGLWTPTAFGQNPYPYGPMPVQYGPMPGQYAPMPYPPMPAFGPNPMMGRPMYYQPGPMMQQPWQAPANPTRVVVYGPLDETVVVAPSNPRSTPANFIALPAKSSGYPATTNQVQALTPMPANMTRDVSRILPTYSKADLAPEGCGAAGNECPQACGPGCDPHRPWDPPLRGRGHFLGETASYFLTPLNSRQAFTTTTAGNSTGTNFAHNVDFGPSASVGYLWHNNWGIRGRYSYLRGSVHQSIDNADPATTILSSTSIPVSPSFALGQGIGVDQFRFAQRLEMHVADIEVLKEASFLDTTFLFSFGGRYARVAQSNTATRTNPGGSNGLVTIANDREDQDSASHFDGWGPTVSFEVVQPIACWGLSGYGNVRGSVLWGINRFGQTYHNTNTTVDAVGVPTFTDVSTANQASDRRTVSSLETEIGLQYGRRMGRCYAFARLGAVYQRWWDVGSPTGPGGNLSFLGGVARLGFTY